MPRGDPKGEEVMPEPTGNFEEPVVEEELEEEFFVSHNDAWGHGPVLENSDKGQTVPTPGEDGRGRSVSATD
jgi:hypothetical protein